MLYDKTKLRPGLNGNLFWRRRSRRQKNWEWKTEIVALIII